MAYSRSIKVATLSIATALLVSCGTANATSRIKKNPSQVQDGTTSTYCEVQGEFVGVSHTANQKVVWTIDVNSRRSVGGGVCPQGARFEIAMRGAEYVESLGQYVYAVDIVQPEPKQRVTANVRLQNVKTTSPAQEYSEWLVTDWNDGFKAHSN